MEEEDFLAFIEWVSDDITLTENQQELALLWLKANPDAKMTIEIPKRRK